MQMTVEMARAACHWFNYYEGEASPDVEDYRLLQAFVKHAYPEQWAQAEAEKQVREAEAREAEAREAEACRAEALHHWGVASNARAARFQRMVRQSVW